MRLLYARKKEDEVDLLIAKHNSTLFFFFNIGVRTGLYTPRIIPRNPRVND